jgi:succinate dehydrogenase/fumarate reductase flavoprotein subunit
MLSAALDAGVDVRTSAPVVRLEADGDRVSGVVVDGESLAGRVVLATGGFQHDERLVASFLPGCRIAPMGVPGCVGAGLRLAMGLGAVLGNMSEGWWMPAMHVPGEELDGTSHYRALRSEPAQPGAILVDRTGRRFVDEAQNYGDVGRAMQRFSAGGSWYPAAPCWLVFDAAYRRRYPVGPLLPEDPDPDWLARAGDLSRLAAIVGLPGDSLAHSVARFNAGAVVGEDPDLGRGSFPYDRWVGDQHAAHPTLAPLTEPPFYALEVQLGCMGTKGGPRTDGEGRVLSVSGRAIEGLYAAGNVAANPFGTATPAGGATLGPALVFGFRAGEAAARAR